MNSFHWSRLRVQSLPLGAEFYVSGVADKLRRCFNCSTSRVQFGPDMNKTTFL